MKGLVVRWGRSAVVGRETEPRLWDEWTGGRGQVAGEQGRREREDRLLVEHSLYISSHSAISSLSFGRWQPWPLGHPRPGSDALARPPGQCD